MKRTTVIISIILVLTMLTVSISPVLAESVTVLDKSASFNWENKIDKTLWLKMKEIDDDTMIPVSIWLKDISHEAIKKKVEKELAFEIDNNIINSDAIDVAFYNDLFASKNESRFDDYHSFESLSQKAKNVSVSDTQLVIKTERSIASQVYSESNLSKIEKICNDTDYSIIYISRYAPNVELYLLKQDIIKCSRNPLTDCVYYCDPNTKLYEDELSDLSISSRDTYDTTFYHVTGLDTARSAFGLNGTGMKVGMLDNYYPMENEVTTHTLYFGGTGTHGPSTSTHATMVAKLMVGYKDGYVGPIPNASLYYNGLINNALSLKPKFEQLLDKCVTAINLSFGIGNTCNTYGDYSKWYDHVIIQHNVHVIISSGNLGSVGVPDSNISYNAIVVGNCDNNGIINTTNNGVITSSFCNSDPLPYKPDLVAPGTDISIIPQSYFPNNPSSGASHSGTSFSAPLVTAAVIQMSQASSLLISNPVLMKSLLISSSTITNGMSSDPMYSYVNSDEIAYSRIYGAGMLYVPNAYQAFMDKGYFCNGTINANTTSFGFNHYINKVTNKHLRVCLTWNKICTLSGNLTTGTINDINLDIIRLIVTDPSGNTYTSAYENDNKQMITFYPTTNGNYHFEIQRIGSSSQNNTIDYAVTWSLQL